MHGGHNTAKKNTVCGTGHQGHTYLAFCNVPKAVLPAVRHFIEVFQHKLYQVPFKWELESQFLNWGKSSVMCTDTLSLTMKGATTSGTIFQPRDVGQVARPLVAQLCPNPWSQLLCRRPCSCATARSAAATMSEVWC